MVISRSRRNFHKFLAIMLLFTFTFFITTASLYAAVKLRYIKILDIAPTLFEIDVLQYQSRAAFSDQDGQFEIAQKLLQLSLFSSIYEREALNLLHALTLNGHAPAQTLEADLIMRYNPKQKAKAMKYYRTAAIQGFAPAAEKMQTFKMASEVSEKYPKAK